MRCALPLLFVGAMLLALGTATWLKGRRLASLHDRDAAGEPGVTVATIIGKSYDPVHATPGTRSADPGTYWTYHLESEIPQIRSYSTADRAVFERRWPGEQVRVYREGEGYYIPALHEPPRPGIGPVILLVVGSLAVLAGVAVVAIPRFRKTTG